jgi:hypothetical protein
MPARHPSAPLQGETGKEIAMSSETDGNGQSIRTDGLESDHPLQAASLLVVTFLGVLFPVLSVEMIIDAGNANPAIGRLLGGTCAVVLVVTFIGLLRLRFGSIARLNYNYERRNRVGFQRVWMLADDEERTLTSRVEARDHQNVQLNTGRFALYETLGGPRAPDLWLGEGGRASSGPMALRHLQFRLTKIFGGDALVRVRAVRKRLHTNRSFEITLDYRTFLLQQELTNGYPPDLAIGSLVQSNQTILKSTDVERQRLRDTLAGVEDKLRAAARTNETLRHQRGALAGIVLASRLTLASAVRHMERSTRLKNSRAVSTNTIEGAALHTELDAGFVALGQSVARDFGDFGELAGYAAERTKA